MLYDEQGWARRGEYGPKVVAFGGGHGLSATLRALRHLSRQITAVVTVADDGGSSGRLRQELDVLPPGDLRMALSALCDDSEWGLTWRDALQHRFHTDAPLDNHAMGNLLITTLWDLLGDEVAGLDWVAKLLHCEGRVLPMAAAPLVIEAEVDFGGKVRTIVGQSKVAKTEGKIKSIRLSPNNPPVRPEVLQAIAEAEWIIMGPGSWYTSVLPHLMLPQIEHALAKSNAHKALVVNLAPDGTETSSMTIADHINVIREFSKDLTFDVVVIDPSTLEDYSAADQAAKELGAKILLRQVSLGPGKLPYHDPLRLAAALRDAFEGYFGDVGEKE